MSAQPVHATQALNLSAGVSNCKVSRGRSLTLGNLPEDELGQGYEYLIKKFADDSGPAEFYTNRTVVHLMTELLEPQPAETIYDPTCGSGGMLLSCITHLRRQGKEWRNVASTARSETSLPPPLPG